MQRQAIIPEHTLRAKRLYRNGLMIRGVVKQVGVSYGTIRRVLHENSVMMRATGVEKCVLSDGNQCRHSPSLARSWR
jgi:hypothetical protein